MRQQSTSAGERYEDTLTGLTDGTEYTARVIASNSNEDSDPAATVTGTPDSEPGQPLLFIENEIVQIFESSSPWMRETWDYVTSQNVAVGLSAGNHGGADVRCSPDQPMESNLRKCDAVRVYLGRSYPSLIYVITHELAHVYTLANSVTSTPGPLGIAHHYFYSLNSRGLQRPLCDPVELYADVLMFLTHGDRARDRSNYWLLCGGTTDSVTEEALAVARSATAGAMPSWFADTYHDSNGDPDLERVWAELKTIPNSKWRATAVFHLRDTFGGYCDNEKATESALAGGVTRNPWSDGGCVPEAPAGVSATAVGGRKLTVSWQAPPDDGGSPIEGYKVQSKSGTQEYDSSRQATDTHRADVRQTISGLTNDESHTLQVLPYNHNGDGAATEATATPTATDTTAPAVLGARADSNTLRLIWNEALGESSQPATTADTLLSSDARNEMSVPVDFIDKAGDVGRAESGALQTVPPRTAPNPQPEVIPRLREWEGGSGSFTLAASPRVVVSAGDGSKHFSGDFFAVVLGGLIDPQGAGLTGEQQLAARLVLADSVHATAYHTSSRRTLDQVAEKIRDDIAALTGLTLTVVAESESVSPQAGDVVVDVLDAADAGIAAEGYELEIGEWVTIRANSTSGVFYGSRTLLQMLALAGDQTAPLGTARDYPTVGHRLIHVDTNRKYWGMDYLADSFRRMSWVKLNAFKLHFADANGWRLHDPGTAAWSGTVSAAPTTGTVTDATATSSLGAPTGVNVTPGDEFLTVRWQPPDVASNRVVRSYRVQVRRQGDTE